MNKKLSLSLIFLVLAFYFGVHRPSSTPLVQTPSKVTPVPNSGEEAKLIDLMRDPASVERIPSGVKIRKFSRSRAKSKKHDSVDIPGLPERMALARNIYALPKNDFHGRSDEIVSESMGMVFFKSHIKPVSSSLVAVEEASGRLYPISSVVKLEDINKDQRHQLISQGFQEHYYHKPTQTMFVQGSHDELLQLSEELRARNLDPQLEVITGLHRTR